MGRGGVRPGAGRKKSEVRRVHLSTTVLPTTYKRLLEMSEERGITIAHLIDKLVEGV